MAKYCISLALYVAASFGAMYVNGLKPILLLGPTKSLPFLLEGVTGLSNPRMDTPGVPKYFWAGILIHFFLLAPVSYDTRSTDQEGRLFPEGIHDGVRGIVGSWSRGQLGLAGFANNII